MIYKQKGDINKETYIIKRKRNRNFGENVITKLNISLEEYKIRLMRQKNQRFDKIMAKKFPKFDERHEL